MKNLFRSLLSAFTPLESEVELSPAEKEQAAFEATDKFVDKVLSHTQLKEYEKQIVKSKLYSDAN